MMPDIQKIDRERDATIEDGFQRWLHSPLVSMAMSMVPAGDHPEALQLLLKTAFRAGADCGTAELMGVLLRQMKRETPGGGHLSGNDARGLLRIAGATS